MQEESKQSSSKWSLHTYTLLGKLSLSRFNLAIQTLAIAVSLGKEKKIHPSLIQRIIDDFLAS